MAGVSSPAFWEELYARGEDGWELGRPAPPLVAHVEVTPPPRGRVAVPGCGRGHDARYLASRGYDVVAFDFAPVALKEARALAAAGGVEVAFEERDVFTLGDAYPEAFDGVWEYTCFCAIDPVRRAEYVRTLAAILRPGGWLLACFFPVGPGAGGPPFPVDPDEVRRLLAPGFRLDRAFTPVASVPARRGREWMVLAARAAG